jgi:hypothetical protein
MLMKLHVFSDQRASAPRDVGSEQAGVDDWNYVLCAGVLQLRGRASARCQNLHLWQSSKLKLFAIRVSGSWSSRYAKLQTLRVNEDFGRYNQSNVMRPRQELED